MEKALPAVKLQALGFNVARVFFKAAAQESAVQASGQITAVPCEK